MARPRSSERRDAIMAAAIRVIATQGLSAPTAAIAKEAAVSNGSLFTYFETKADLLNTLYVELKKEMAVAALNGLPAKANLRGQLQHVWSQWLHWAIAYPERRRTLAHLTVSDDITAASHREGDYALGGLVNLVEQSRAGGPMQDAPRTLVMTVMSGVAEATMDLMMRDPDNADAHCATTFEAVWRMIT